VGAFAAGNPALLKRLILIMLNQKEKAFELGYRSFISGFSVDVNGIIIFTMTLWKS
jgi:hypothetical protein